MAFFNVDTWYTTAHHMSAAARSATKLGGTFLRSADDIGDAARTASKVKPKGWVFKYAADGSRSIRKSTKGWAALGLGGAMIATPLGGILGQGAGNAMGGMAGGLIEGLTGSGALVPCISSCSSLGCILVLVLVMMMLD